MNPDVAGSESVPNALDEQTDKPSQSIERKEADRSMADARRLFEVATWVHGRRVVGGVDSALFAHRALTALLGLLLRVHGARVPEDFAKLVEGARVIAKAESLLDDDAGDELLIIDEMRARAVDLGSKTSAADERRYDRAFVKSREWLGAVQAYVDQRLPKPKANILNSLAVVFVVVLAFAIGVVVGQRLGGDFVAPSEAARVAAPSSPPPVGPAFETKFYRGATFNELIASRRDSTISFKWERAPADGVPTDFFSARWDGRLNIGEAGKYTFFLTSDDGSRLFIDDALVVDNWGNHSEVTQTGTIALEPGVHALRVEYFDEIGDALIRLEWSSERSERRLVGPQDLR